MKKAAVIGIVGESVFLEVDNLPKAGQTVHATDIFNELGGKGFNQALAIARCGVQVSFLTAVGNDSYKEKVEDFCYTERITPFVIEKTGKTPYAAIHTEKSGENFVTVYGGVQLSVEDVETFKDEIANAQFLLVTNEIPQEVIERAVEIAVENDVKIMYNPAPVKEISDHIKEKVYLFTPNEHEQVGFEHYDNLIITMGKRGCYIKSLDTQISPKLAAVVDTTGAGDTFNGVLTAMLVKGKNLKDAVEIANEMAAKSTEKRGVIQAIPYFKK